MISKRLEKFFLFLLSGGTLVAVLLSKFPVTFLNFNRLFSGFDNSFLAFATYDKSTNNLLLALVLLSFFYIVLEFLKDNPFISNMKAKKAMWLGGSILCIAGAMVFLTLTKRQSIFKKSQENYTIAQQKIEKAPILPSLSKVEENQEQEDEISPKKKRKIKILKIAKDAKEKTFKQLIEEKKYAELAIKAGKADHRTLNSVNDFGQTPITIAILNDDREAIEILMRTKRIDLDKVAKNTPSVAKNPLGWAFSKIWGGAYVHPMEMVQSKEAGKALREAGLTETQKAKLSDRMEELKRESFLPAFVVKNQNAILMGTFIFASVAVAIGAYYKFSYLVNKRNVLIASSIYALLFSIWYFTPMVYDYRLTGLKEKAVLSQVEAENLKEKFSQSNPFKRIYLVFTLPKKNNFVEEVAIDENQTKN